MEPTDLMHYLESKYLVYFHDAELYIIIIIIIIIIVIIIIIIFIYLFIIFIQGAHSP